MRKFTTNVALESALPQGPKLSNISMEEEAVIVDQANQDAGAADEAIVDANRTLAVSDAFEDLAVVASQIESATPTELQLIQSSGQMAVAGTTTDPEMLMPSMEDSSGSGFAVGAPINHKSFSGRSNALYQVVKKLVKEIWNRIESYFESLVVIPAMASRLAVLKHTLTQLGSAKTDVKAFNVRISPASLSNGGTAILDGKGLVKAAEDLLDAASVALSDNAAFIVSRVGAVADAIGDANSGNAPVKAKELVDKLAAIKPPSIPNGRTVRNVSTTFDVTEGKPLLGGVVLRLNSFSTSGTGTVLGDLERLRFSGLTLATVATQAGGVAHVGDGVGGGIGMDIMSPQELKGLVEICEKLIGEVYKYKSGGSYKSVIKARDDLEKASEAASNAKPTEADGGANGENHLRAMLNFNLAMGAWIQDPGVAMIRKILEVVRALMAVAAKGSEVYDVSE